MSTVAVGCTGGRVSLGDTGSTPSHVGTDSGVTSERALAELADMSLWTAATGTDPFADHRPEDDACPDEGLFVENDTVFEIDTNLCHYGWFEQPLLSDLKAEDRVQVVLWHNDLFSADGPAEGQAALLVGERLLWEMTVPPRTHTVTRPV